MSASPPPSSEAWLKSPIVSTIGTVWLAGRLHGRHTIPPNRMRVLGKFGLILMDAGRGDYADASGVQRTLRPGDAVLVSPAIPHAYGGRDGQAWGQVYTVFSGPQFELLQGSPGFTAHQPVWHLEPATLWVKRMEEILFADAPSTPAGSLRTVGRFAQLLVEMAAADAEARERPRDAWLETSRQLLGEPQRGEWLSPQAVAARLGQSYEAFRKRFAARTGLAPGKFQQQRRIDLACAALYQGRDNFKELAEELGFCDVYHFSKVFRQVVGQPPATYRRTVRGG